MLVKQIMSHPVVSCQVDDHVNLAAQRMWENDCGVVPILNEEGRVIAMLTDRDICMAAYTQGKPLDQILVSSVMSKRLYACNPEDTLDHAEQLMRDHQIRRLSVIDPMGKPVGILSLNDVACASARNHGGELAQADGISHASTARTLAAVCAHRLAEANHLLA
jgi:CBS domain-containing protein